MQIMQKKTKDLIPYAQNTKKHDSVQINNVAESIRQYGFVQPIVIDKNGVVVIGHCRLSAAKKLGMQEVPCVCVEDLTEEQVNALRIVDNKSNESEWDMDFLKDELAAVDLSMFDFDFGIDDDEQKQDDEVQHCSLVDQFIVPPFSVFDTKQGYWQDRKRQWLSIGIKSEQGRKQNLSNAPDLPSYARYGKSLKGVAPQTSIFDPVLCEIIYRWFNVAGGSIYDCFAGGSVRGIVAEMLGYRYTGIDLRQEQIDANNQNAKEIGVCPTWFCDDSKNADKYLQDESVDLVFSCPPYADLEVYSDDPRDISNMEYNDFCDAYRQIITTACRKLKNNRFAVFVVGDVRDKNGNYRNFVDFTKKCFNENGVATYNEIILLEQIGTSAMRVKPTFKNRKLVKVHQNVLVFFKGDAKTIKDNYGDIEIDESVFECFADGE